MKLRLLVLCAVFLNLGVAEVHAEARNRALLVGVSNYPVEMVGDYQLAGPKNDVALMMDTIALLGFKDPDITVLADSLDQTDAKRPANGAPTRAAILKALSDLANVSATGDFALVYLSGHGSQQPDSVPSKHAIPKPDGLDEIFLPIDIGHWDDGIQAVNNALVDVEFGAAVNAIRAKGTTVWVVIDACHSGTMTRGASDDGVVRQVPAARLGVPEAALARAKANAPKTRGAGGTVARTASAWGDVPSAATPAGDYVAFFAAYPDQAALQRNLPKGYGASDRKPQGVLTFYLAQALRSGRVSSFRDIAHRVLAGYEEVGGEAPTPMFEGNLNLGLPGGTDRGQRYFTAHSDGTVISVDAGVLDGLSQGAVVSLARPETQDVVIAFGQVKTADAAHATLALLNRDGRTATVQDFQKDTTFLTKIIEHGVSLNFRVKLPGQDKANIQIDRALLLVKQSMPHVDFVETPDTQDLNLVCEDGRLWLIPESGRLQKTGRGATPSIELTRFDDAVQGAELLRKVIAAYAKAKALISAADSLQGGAGPNLKIEGFVLRDSSKQPGPRAPDDRACATANKDKLPEGTESFSLGGSEGLTLPRLAHCDQVYFKVTNDGDFPVDVTPLYVDGQAGISYLGPPEGMRLEPKSPARLIPFNIITFSQKRGIPLAIGQERVLFVSVEQKDRNAIAADFRYLAQAAPPTNATRGSGENPLRELLDAAAFGSGNTRGASAGSAGSAAISSFRWQVVAPEGE